MRKTLILAAALALVLVTPSAFAQSNSASVSAAASAKIIAAITLTNPTALNFGDVVPTAAGTVLMSTTGTRTATGPTLGNPNGASQGIFNVGGQASATYAITLPSAAVTLSDGASHTMTVDTFLGSKTTGTLSAGGADSFTVGATLNVGASQVAGSYTGNYTVSVNYN